MYRLFMLSMAVLMSACVDIKLGEQQLVQPVQELPYKYYQAIGPVCQATDGSFATVLTRLSTNQAPNQYTSPYLSRSEVVMVKTSVTGRIQWTKVVWSGTSIGGNRSLVHPLADGSYLVFLTVRSPNQAVSTSYMDYILIRISATGDILPQTLPNQTRIAENFLSLDIISLPGNGFYVKGQVYSTNKLVPYIMRFDEQGQLLWQVAYDQAGVVGGTYGLASLSSGGLILSRYGTNSTKAMDGILLKIDAAGQTVWLKRNPDVGASYVIESPNKGYGLVSQEPYPLTGINFFRLDSEGLVQGSKRYASTTSQSITPLGIYATANAYELIYTTSSYGISLLTTDEAGNEQSRQQVGGTGDNLFNGDHVRLADGSFVFAVWNGSTTISLLKTKPDKTPEWRTVIASNT